MMNKLAFLFTALVTIDSLQASGSNDMFLDVDFGVGASRADNSRRRQRQDDGNEGPPQKKQRFEDDNNVQQLTTSSANEAASTLSFDAIFGRSGNTQKRRLEEWDFMFQNAMVQVASVNPQLETAMVRSFDAIFGKPAPSIMAFPFPAAGEVLRLPAAVQVQRTGPRATSVLTEQPFTFPENFSQNNRERFLRKLGNNPIRVFFDTETTGIGADDRIIEIAFILCNYATMKELRWYSLINPDGRRSAPKAFEAHKISEGELVGQPKFGDIVDSFSAFIGNHTLVAHNVGFDRRMVNNELRRLGKAELPPERFDCTLLRSRRIYAGEKNTLDAVCERLEVDLSVRSECHGSMQDSLLLREIYPYLVMADS